MMVRAIVIRKRMWGMELEWEAENGIKIQYAV